MSADRSSSDGRPVTLFTGQWADLPLAELAAESSEWGFDGLELACWGDGEPEGVRTRAAERIKDAARAAAAFGVQTVTGFTTRRALEALDGREGFGINLTERGWTFVSPGHGDVDFEALLRALNRIGYEGPLSIEWEDSGMDRDRDALGSVRRSDFAPSTLAFDAAFQSEPSA
jgi:sugar phosphate isomerase/epimerase